MADIAITANNVVIGKGASVENGIAGEAIAAGKAVYQDKVSKKYLLADSNSATIAARSPRGVALNGSALNQPLAIAKSGPVTIGATLVSGTAYYLSDTPGGICPVADVGTGENVVIIGYATSTSVLNIDIGNTGVTL